MPGAQPAPAHGEFRILVVDDEPVIVEVLIKIFGKLGYTCAAAYDGDEAIEKAREFQPNLVITGVIMPRMNGIEAAKRIVDEQPACEILFFSGQAYCIDLEAAAKGYNFLPILQKPVHPRVLVELAAGSAARSHARR